MTIDKNMHVRFFVRDPYSGAIEPRSALCHNKVAMGRRRKRRPLKLNLDKDTILSIAAVLLLLAAGLTFVSFFAQAASVNFALQRILNKLFGWGVVLLPFILALAGLNLLRTIRWRFVNLNNLFGLTLFTLAGISLVHLLFFDAKTAHISASLGDGGGIVGYKIQLFLRQAFGSIGAALILLGVLIIALMIGFNTSLEKTIEMLGLITTKLWRALKKAFAALQQAAKRLRRPSIGGSRSEIELGGMTAAEQAVEPEYQVVAAPAEPAAKKRGATQEQSADAQKAVTNVPFSSQVWEYPPLDLLNDPKDSKAQRGNVKENAAVIERALASFGIEAKVVEINLGPAVTQYALESSQGTKIAKITNLQNDLAMALASPTGSVRIEAPIPGKSQIGIEVPNYAPTLVTLKNILQSEPIKNARSKLTVALGLNVAGQPVIDDISRMPHVLIAGATGSGKSILLHSFISTILFRASPQEVKLILVDPKRVELTRYNGIPHLLTRVITDPERALPALKWLLSEMDRRYKLFEDAGTRDIDAYNELSGFQALPYIVVVVDELADLMMIAANEVEKTITRLAQMSRATGIYLILATQRPSVDVLTGLIKANIPCRIAFNVTSQVDSRVIIDQSGAEKLLGKGDMLYVPPDTSKPIRIQGVFVSERELSRLTEFLRAAPIEPDYKEEVTEYTAKPTEEGEPEDELFEEALKIICEHDRASASLLQRRLRIGYARAARLLDELETRGIVSEQDGSKPREVLIHDPEAVIAP
jgi:S-DNA-T family DNA segregation ATPase FtsK/SpoIIIE